MKTSALAAVVLCAVGLKSALASPSVHHAHQHMHKKSELTWEKISYSSSATPAAPSPTAAAGCGRTDPDGYCLDGYGGRTDPVDNGNVDQYMGNRGVPYGSNMQLLSADCAHTYKYTNKFVSIASGTITIAIWNKNGVDGAPNSGQFLEPALKFDLAPGACQYVGWDENSQVAWCHDTGKRTQWGAKDCTYGEADFGNLSNGGFSGYDVSSIQNTDGNTQLMTITCPNGMTSSNYGNNYVDDTQPGGIGGNLGPGEVRLETKIA